MAGAGSALVAAHGRSRVSALVGGAPSLLRTRSTVTRDAEKGSRADATWGVVT